MLRKIGITLYWIVTALATLLFLVLAIGSLYLILKEDLTFKEFFGQVIAFCISVAIVRSSPVFNLGENENP